MAMRINEFMYREGLEWDLEYGKYYISIIFILHLLPLLCLLIIQGALRSTGP